MAIKYVCDFCGQEPKATHKEFSTGEIVCDDCYDHLKKQTWRLAEEPRELEKAKELIQQESKRLTRQREQFLKEQEMDRRLAARYQKGFHALVQLYNQMVEALDSILPNGFLFNKRKPFRTISEEEINSVSPYLFCRWLSGNQFTILASNELNKYYNEIPFLNQFMMIRKTFGGKIKFIPFPKTLKDEESNEIKCLEKYFKISYNKANSICNCSANAGLFTLILPSCNSANLLYNIDNNSCLLFICSQPP